MEAIHTILDSILTIFHILAMVTFLEIFMAQLGLDMVLLLLVINRGPMPAGMQMVPMVLPDGRIGYVLQQPGVQVPAPRPRRNDRGNGPGGQAGRGGGSGNDDGNRNRRDL
ncbi:heterogeneous nuclear ribonucleoprotein q-like [Trifolium pratense]|uniref:Heterogeneous nuclear ribonucleoprotein q-like n=1 Tax=Trifolium pratense TaxID=57577 RepID=A0A2K3LUG4_TRIPR|nr:heterogeneous nuclear ribonucleoprotein q-like [Trifolium pratense]